MHLNSKGKIKQNEKTANRQGENTPKWRDQQGRSLRSWQASHSTKRHENKQPSHEMAQDLNRFLFPKEDIHMVKRHMKRCLRSLSNKCKSKLQWHGISHQLKWLSPKNQQKINAGDGVESRKSSYSAGESLKLVQPRWRSAWRFLTKN